MCECRLILCAFLVSNVILVTCFNVDQENFAIYRLENNSSMFGFTVAVHKDGGNRGWVLVGAPEAQSSYQGVSRGGAVYKCRVDVDNRCQEVPFDTTGNTMMKTNPLDEKSGQWFGATLSSSGQTNGPIVACAPRYVWFTRDLNRRDPVGTCFVSNGAFDDFEEYSPCRTMNWGYHRQGYGQAGFSAAINGEGDRLYVGAPGSYYWQGQMYSIDAHATFNYTPGYFGSPGYGAPGSVHQQSLENRPAVFSTREGQAPDDDSYIGYSTVVGHFKQNEVYEGIAVGMPRGNKLRGKVLLFTWDLTNYKNITISKQIGSYFGYALAAADINGDKKLDLIVGAPMHTEPNTEGKYDVGRVYVFYQQNSSAESYNTHHFIDGINSKGRFGLSLASLGDMNQDGYDDFAVGAPYDGPNGRGAVYICYGSKNGIREKPGQVIFAEEIQSSIGSLTTFGFSLAGGMDLDGNEYPDMAVGAYLSETAFFFRSRPVVLIDGSVRFKTPNKQIDIKQKNCRLPNGLEGTCTDIDFCIRYSGKGIPQQLYLTVQYILDTKKPSAPRMGFLTRGTHTFNDTLLLYKDNRDNCKLERVYVKSEIKDKLTPLEAEIRFFMVDESSSAHIRNPQSQLKPVLDLNNPPSMQDSIVVQKNCGTDNVCVPNLHVNVTSNVEKYLLGSKRNLEFDVIVSNFGEDAFETTFELKYPEGIYYKKIDTKANVPGILCSNENRTIICDIGNPLPAGRIASFKVLLQPYYKEGMPATYEFDAYVNSTNPEATDRRADNHQHISIAIWIDASLDLRGESYPATVYYNESTYASTSQEIKRESDIGPLVTHVYYLSNQGPATIQEAEIFILWPLTTLGGEDLLYLLDKPYTRGNVECDAAPNNYKHYELDYHRTPIWDRLKIDTSSIEVSSSQKTVQGKTTETGSGVSSGVGVVNKNTNIDKDLKWGGGDSSSVFERRHNESQVNSWGTLNPNGLYEHKEARFYTTVVNGAPVTRWENKTTIRDAKGNILNTYYFNDGTDEVTGIGGGTSQGLTNSRNEILSQGTQKFNMNGGDSSSGFQRRHNDSHNSWGTLKPNGVYEYKEARYYTTIENGIPVTKWENKTIVRDSKGKILNTFYYNDKDEVISLGGATTQEELRVQETKVTQENNRLIEERRRQEQMRIDEQRRITDEQRRMDEQRRINEQRRIDNQRRIDEQRRINEQRIIDERRREDERNRIEELRRADQTKMEERRRAEDQRRIEESERAEDNKRLEAIRRQEIARQEEEQRRKQIEYETRYGISYKPSLADQNYQSSGNNQNFRTEEERRRYYDEIRRQESRRQGINENYERINTGSPIRESSRANQQPGIERNRVLTGYFDENGVYHNVPRNHTGHLIYNRTDTVETSIPIELSGGTQNFRNNLEETALGSGFTVQTLGVGGEGSESSVIGSAGVDSGEVRLQSQSGSRYSKVDEFNSAGENRQNIRGQAASGHTGGFRREWSANGGYSESGTIPPTFFNNRIEGDNVPAGTPNGRVSRTRRMIERDPYAEIQAMAKCNSTNCVYIRCVVADLEKDKEVAIALRSRLNVRAIKELTTSQAVKVSSMVIGKITKLPYLGDVREQVSRKYEIFTDIPGKEAELVPEVVPLWVYVVSAVAGIVMLLLLIWILSKCGFFKRNRPSSAPERQPLNRNGYHSGDEAL